MADFETARAGGLEMVNELLRSAPRSSPGAIADVAMATFFEVLVQPPKIGGWDSKNPAQIVRDALHYYACGLEVAAPEAAQLALVALDALLVAAPPAPDGEPHPEIKHPGGRATMRLTAAVLAALEAGLVPERIRAIVEEDLPAPDGGQTADGREALLTALTEDDRVRRAAAQASYSPDGEMRIEDCPCPEIHEAEALAILSAAVAEVRKLPVVTPPATPVETGDSARLSLSLPAGHSNSTHPRAEDQPTLDSLHRPRRADR